MVVELVGVAWRTVGSIIARVFADLDATSDRLDGLRRIGIDEISYKRGQRYLIVAVDHDRRALVWAAPGRDRATVAAFFDELGPDRCKLITHASADGAAFNADVVADKCLNAVQCADPLHIVSWATDACYAPCWVRMWASRWSRMWGFAEGPVPGFGVPPLAGHGVMRPPGRCWAGFDGTPASRTRGSGRPRPPGCGTCPAEATNAAWLETVLTAVDLVTWTQLIASPPTPPCWPAARSTRSAVASCTSPPGSPEAPDAPTSVSINAGAGPSRSPTGSTEYAQPSPDPPRHRARPRGRTATPGPNPDTSMPKRRTQPRNRPTRHSGQSIQPHVKEGARQSCLLPAVAACRSIGDAVGAGGGLSHGCWQHMVALRGKSDQKHRAGGRLALASTTDGRGGDRVIRFDGA
jgi:hypothetical protein